PIRAARSRTETVTAGGSPPQVHPTPTPPPRRRSHAPGLSQLIGRFRGARGFGAGLPAALALGYRLVHGGLEIVAEIVPELLPHLLHELGDARRVVLVEVAVIRRVGQRIEPGLLRFHGGESGHQARERGATTARARRRGRRRRPEHEQ